MTLTERSQLFDALSELPPQDMERLLFELHVPRKNIPGPAASPGERVAALLAWAESYIGCDLVEVEARLSKLGRVESCSNSNILAEFKDYLNSVCEDYQNYWKHYAFIDEINESTWFEFSLDTQIKAKQQEKNEPPQDNEPQQTKRKPILQVIQEVENQSLLIYGSSGSGKSTLLARLFYEAALKARQGKSDLIPVLVELKSYETEGEDSGLEGLILSSLQSHDFDLDKDGLKQIRKKHLALFIDGFNELPNESAKPKIKKYCRNIPIVATSRNEGDWRELGQSLEIQPLTHKEVTYFFHKHLPDDSQTDLEVLCNRVRDFGDTPLMVWMLYSIFNTNKEIPETRGEAYRRFTTLYLERSKEGINLTESQTLLSKLAFEMMRSTSKENLTDFRLEISEADAQILLGSKVTLRLLSNCHLLKSQGKPGNRRIKFCHQSLQEYYAAEELLSRTRKYFFLSDAQHFQHFYLNLRKWTEPIKLMLSILENLNHVDKIIDLARSIDLVLGARLAGAVHPDNQNRNLSLLDIDNCPIWMQIHILSEIKSLDASDVLLEFLNDADLETRKKAVWASRKLNPSRAEFIILKAFQDTNPSVRETAIRTLSTLDQKHVFEIVRNLLYKEKEANVRMAIVINILGKDNSEESVTELLRASQDVDYNTATMASYQVEKMMPEVFPTLIKLLRYREKAVCKSAIEVLARVGDETCLISLFEAKLSNDDDIHIEACFAIRKIEDRIHSTSPSALKDKATAKQQKINYWVSNLNSENSTCRGNAIDSLSSLLPKEDATKMVLEAISDPHHYVRGHAIGNLEKLFGEDAIHLLIKALDDPHRDVREIAAQRLSAIAKNSPDQIVVSSNTLSKLIYYIEFREDSNTVSHDVEVLRNLCSFVPGLPQNERLENALLILLEESKDNLLRSKVVRTLRYFSSRNVIDSLMRLLTDSDLMVSLGAAESLKYMPAEVTVMYLPELQNLYFSEGGSISVGVIESIQSRCEFYNYEVAQLQLESVEDQSLLDNGQTFHFHAPVGVVNTGSVTIEGDQKGFN
ncbi:HEAT repeat domain-containing protein [Leptolyngbya sp. CCNP1308]|uniref:HEAT repeat domain-containing protein n=1 Tax=Leptolyngbya sp. CCNP1308 TaxID=3110255 RepID=UPI002B201846|nr:HEAT repeat domain-containing protein [Leptolyngbya sp. CCNP1308]MEA5452100.1 HEAT repeat domain-containing protein [Leptolyngbya sp. CCNP1308]